MFPAPRIESRSRRDENPEASARLRIEKLALGVPRPSAALLAARMPKSMVSDPVDAGDVNEGCACASTGVETVCENDPLAASWLVLLTEIVPLFAPTVAVFIER